METRNSGRKLYNIGHPSIRLSSRERKDRSRLLTGSVEEGKRVVRVHPMVDGHGFLYDGGGGIETNWSVTAWPLPLVWVFRVRRCLSVIKRMKKKNEKEMVDFERRRN